MKISARNKLLRQGDRHWRAGAPSTAVVKIQLTGTPTIIQAVITNEAVPRTWSLAEGERRLCAVIKASSVLVGICNEGAGCGKESPSAGE